MNWPWWQGFSREVGQFRRSKNPLDTSAFAKRYVAAAGPDKLLALCQQADTLAVSVICLPELISTLARLVREKKLTKAEYRKLKRDAIADLRDVDVSPH